MDIGTHVILHGLTGTCHNASQRNDLTTRCFSCDRTNVLEPLLPLLTGKGAKFNGRSGTVVSGLHPNGRVSVKLDNNGQGGPPGLS